MDAICPPAGSQGRIVDLSFLSEEEQAKIKSVLDRSVDVIKEEEMRLDEMSRDIERDAEAVRKRAATLGVCVQCETGLPWYRSGARCPECFQIVCKQCRVPPRVKRDFRCTLCEKKRLFRIEKSDCFKFEESSPKDEDDVFGTNLLKRSLKNLELFNSQFPPCKLTRVQTLPPSKGAQSRAEELKSSTPKSTRKTSIEDPPYPDKDVKRSSSQNLPPSSSADEPSQTSPAESEDPDPVPYLERRVSLASSAQSTYSGGGGKGDYSITGEVLFGVEYRNGQLLVHIGKARDLAAADRNGSSDPYVKTYLLPDINKDTKRKTTIVKKNLNPIFNEALKYEMAESELKEKTLWLSVWDWDRFGKNQFLGEVRVPLSEFDLSTKTEKWWPLTDKGPIEQDGGRGEVLISLKAEPMTSKTDYWSVQVEVREASRLPPMNSHGHCDSFVKCVMLPDGEDKAQKSRIVERSCNPVWKAHFVFDYLTSNQVDNSLVLEVTVWDASHKHKSFNFIGGLRIGPPPVRGAPPPWMDSNEVEASHWSEMIGSAGVWVERWHSLRSTMQSNRSPKPAPKLLSDLKSIREEHPVIHSPTIVIEGSPGQGRRQKSEWEPHEGFGKMVRSESLSSFSSAQSTYSGGGGKGDYSITGEVLFGVEYRNRQLLVHVNEARDLAAADRKTHSSNPYVKTYLLPDLRKETKRKTKPIKKTLNPTFTEILKYEMAESELKEKTLWLSVWDWDRFGKNQFLGEVRVPLSEFDLSTKTEKWWPLTDKDVSHLEDQVSGDLLLGVMFELPGTLHIEVKQARKLRKEHNPNATVDAFVKCYLLPDRHHKGKRKTNVVKNNSSPVWMEQVSFAGLGLAELRTGRVLEVTVWDMHRGSSNEFIGGLRIGCAGSKEWMDSSLEEAGHWNEVLSSPGRWVERWHSLRTTMTSTKAASEGSSVSSRSRPLPPGGSPLASIARKKSRSSSPTRHNRTSKSSLGSDISSNKDILSQKEESPLPTIEGSVAMTTTISAKDEKGEALKVAFKPAHVDSEVNEKPSSPQEVQPRSPQEVQPRSPQEVQPRSPQEVKPSSPQEVKPSSPQEVQPRSPQEVKPSSPQEVKPSSPQEVKPSSPQEVKPSSPQEVQPRSPQEVQPRSPQEVKPSSPQEVQPRSPQEVQPRSPQEVQPRSPQEVKPSSPQEVKPSSPQEVNEQSPIPDIVVDPSSSISLEPSQDASVTQEVHASSLARAESFTSLYSTAFEKGDYSITGEVLFGVEYRNGQLLVHIGKARDLAAADRNGSSDPYVKTYLLPDKKKETKRKTKVVKKSLSPVYNEVLQYEMAESELKEKTLWLSVWDWDRFGKNQFLGEVRVPLSEFDLSTKTEKWWPLTDKSSPPTALQWTSVQARSATLVSQKGLPRAESFTSLYSTAGEKGDYSITGEVLFGVEYRNGQLLVHVNEARDMAAADKNGKSNPYIKTYLLPDKKKETKKKTKVMKKTLNPKFDEILKYKLSSLELSQKTLWLSIWSADKFGRNLFLGQVMVPLDKVDLSNGQTKWHTLEDK